MFAGICASAEFRIEYGGSRRQFGVGHMMVADDEVYAFVFGIFDFLIGLYAAVEYDDELDIAAGGIVNAFARYAIPLLVAGRDVIFYVGIVVLQVFVDERHGGGSVHVVVAVNHNPLFGAHGFVEAMHRLVHVGHEERVMKVVERWCEKFLCFFG